MQRVSLTINVVLLIAVAALYYLHFSGKPDGAESNTQESKKVEAPKIFSDPTQLANAKIAYVNIDSLDSKYGYISDFSKTFKTRQANIEAQLNGMVANFQKEYADFQQAVQAGLRSEAELKKKQAELEQQQYDIASKEKQLQGIAEEVAAKQGEMLRNVSGFVSRYNNNKYDFILAYSSNIGSVLYAKPGLEITSDIIKGLNEEYKTNKATIKK